MRVDLKDLSDGVLSVLPMFYVGWSDSVLSPSEIKLVHSKIEALSFLSAEDKSYLIKWTDPKSPPTKDVFQFWVSQLNQHAKRINFDQKKSLVDLGLQIAMNNTQSQALWENDKTRNALKDIELALGVESTLSTRIFTEKFDANRQKNIQHQYSFSPEKLAAFMDGDYAEVKQKMRSLLRDPVFKIQHFPDKKDKRADTLKQVKYLAKQGVSAYAFPTKYGGLQKKGEHIAVFEMLGYGDQSLAIKFGVQFGLFGGAVYSLGTEKHHKKYVEALSKAELLGCFAMTETGHGSNVRGLETTASYDHSTKKLTIHTPRVTAGKEYIGNAMDSTMAAVFCQLIVDGVSHGVHAVLVPIRDQSGNLLPGVKVEDCGYKMGLNGVDNGRIWFDQVEVPVENLLDKYGQIDEAGNYQSPLKSPSKRFFTMLGALVVGRICVGLAGISAAKTGLNIAVRYALKRRQFSKEGKTEEMLIMDYPSHQHRLFPLVAKNYGYYFALRELARNYVDAKESDIRKIETLAAGLKAKATWLSTESLQVCREACGGKGYLWENRFADLKADTDIFTTFEGDNTVLMQLVAKGMLTDYNQSFHNEGYRAVIKHIYTQVSNKMSSLNPVNTRNTNYSHLIDRAFHLHAFKFRETKLLISLSERMRSYIKKRVDGHQAFLKCQTHMIALANAYIDRVVLKAFVRAIRNCEDENSKKLLSKICDLYALQVIYEERGWFLENDYLEGQKSKAIRRVINKVNQDLRPDIGGIVEAFNIPEELVNAEIV